MEYNNLKNESVVIRLSIYVPGYSRVPVDAHQVYMCIIFDVIEYSALTCKLYNTNISKGNDNDLLV